MKYSFFITLLLFSFTSSAQVKDTGIIITNPKDTSDIEFETVQVPAQFPGGVNGWKIFLEQNLNANVPVKKKAPAGRYTVLISFVVDIDGSISGLTLEKDPGYGTGKEAIRILKKSPKWIPATLNGKKVKYIHKQSISFQVNEE